MGVVVVGESAWVGGRGYVSLVCFCEGEGAVFGDVDYLAEGDGGVLGWGVLV